MSHFLEILCLLIISVTKQSVYGSTHALVGNFSELNPKDCGITRFTPTLDYSCFKWHKNNVEELKGRNATEDEVPWIVQLNGSEYYKCTGAFIGDHWVLTSAHCLPVDEPELYFIVPGIHPFPKDPQKIRDNVLRANRVIKHPDFTIKTIEEINDIFAINDIGLIELNESIDYINSIKQSVPFKSICLPQKNVFNTKQEFSMYGGWGQVDRYEMPLQIGINLIYPPDDYATVLFASFIVSRRMDNQMLLCKGDSGGPSWQYYNGRAVIIGVNCMTRMENASKCESQNYVVPNFNVRVSKYIDWIKSVTQLN